MSKARGSICFSLEEWAIIHDFLSTQIGDKVDFTGYSCLETRIRYGKMSDENKAKFLVKLGLEDE